MATYGSTVRRGLPRRPGGEPWPPAGDAPGEVVTPIEAPVGPPASAEPSTSGPAAAASGWVGAASEPATRPELTPKREGVRTAVRRGLPRVPGGEPWPPAGEIAAPTASVSAPQTAEPRTPTDGQAPVSGWVGAASEPVRRPELTPTDGQAPVSGWVGAASGPVRRPELTPKEEGVRTTVRRGLPRMPGGEAWPPAGFAPDRRAASAVAAAAEVPAAAATTPDAADVSAVPKAPARTVRAGLRRPPAQASAAASVPAAEAAASVVVAAAAEERPPLPFTRTVWQGAAGRVFEAERRSGVRIEHPVPKRYGPFTRLQWVGAVLVGGAGLLVAAGMAVALTRWFLSLEFMQDFLVAYPGEYHLPGTAPVGLPAWLGWQHFFNVFLMVLIIRSGLRVRTEQRPTAFWTPRLGGRGNGKISLALWFHQSLDILWLLNGAIFVVLLFVTGQWMRLVPTSWEVFPNALSAALQYVSLDWPTENGWVNYNSLQQLAYFTTVFLAAPLAAITGARMTKLWPAQAAINRLYPVEWARAVHFPVMLYFVLFIVVHVTLVFATGALRNLNHMYAAQGSVDGVQYADNWAGFWIFFASLVVIAGAWVAARPLVLAPIAKLFGTVSAR